MTVQPLIHLQGLSKSYGGVHALRDVTLEIAPGEIHAICGENGAGKSTLIKLLAGIVAPDRGDILTRPPCRNSEAAPRKETQRSPQLSTAGALRSTPITREELSNDFVWQHLTAGNVELSEAAGIAVMHQESTAFPDLNVVDNLFVGRELTCLGGLLLDRAAMIQRTQHLLHRLGVSLNLTVPVGELPLAQRQMVALARALARQCRLLIMDEPTASLSKREIQTLLRLIQQLRSTGVSVLYVSHRLEEIFEIADRVTVLRDGVVVATHNIGDVDTNQLIREMVGRDVTERQHPPGDTRALGPAMLVVEGLTRCGVLDNISFQVRAGETVGLTGLVGAGRSEIARAVFGIDRYDRGQVLVAGRQLSCGSVQQAIAAGIAMVPEDRHQEGLVLPMSVGENISLAILPSLTHWGLVSQTREYAIVDQQIQDLTIKAASRHVPAATLSGGNQQKLVLGKWLATRPRVLILDEPTRGVDVGAKMQVHQLIRQLARNGLATLVISSDLPELFSLCDRLLVVRNGRIAAGLSVDTTTPEEVLSLALPDAESPITEGSHTP